MNELLEENKSLKEHLSQLKQQQQSQVTNDPSSLSSFNSPVDETPQLQNGVIEKIIVRKMFLSRIQVLLFKTFRIVSIEQCVIMLIYKIELNNLNILFYNYKVKLIQLV